MFSSISSLFGLFSSSICYNQVTVITGVAVSQPHDTPLEPEIDSQEEIINQLMLTHQKVQNYSYQEKCSQANDIENKCFYITKNLIDAIRGECHKFAIHFFANQIANDSTIINDENRWVELFAVIEECMQKSLKEIAICCKGIAVGYFEEAGMPKFAAKIFQLGEPIYFGDSTKCVKPSDYLSHLFLVAQKKMSHFIEMHRLDTKILSNLELAGKKPGEGVTRNMANFLRTRIEKIIID